VRIGKKYRAWKEDWPEASKWALPLWLGCALLVGAGAWSIYRDWNRSDSELAVTQRLAKAASGKNNRPDWVEQASAAARLFPSDPMLWQEAARLWMLADRPAARNLLSMAAAVRPDSTTIRGDLAATTAGNSEAASAWATRAFELEASSDNYLLVNSALGPVNSNAEVGEAMLARACSARSESAAAYVGWLMIRNRWPEALSWINGLPSAISATPFIRARRVDLLCRLGDFAGIRSELAQGAWGPSDSDAVALALSACLANQHGREGLGHDLWLAAIDAAGRNPEAMKAVLRIAFSFGLDQPSAQSFERVLAQHPIDQETIREFQIWMRLHPNPEPTGGLGAS